MKSTTKQRRCKIHDAWLYSLLSSYFRIVQKWILAQIPKLGDLDTNYSLDEKLFFIVQQAMFSIRFPMFSVQQLAGIRYICLYYEAEG